MGGQARAALRPRDRIIGANDHLIEVGLSRSHTPAPAWWRSETIGLSVYSEMGCVMTGVELIVAALAAGAAAGITDTASSAIRDTYVGLKDLLAHRLAGRNQTREALDAHETDHGVWQARLGDDLAASGAATDQRILTAALQMLELLDPHGAQSGKYQVDLREAKGVQVGDGNTQTNTFS